ncbi:MAG: glycosyltransferase [Roseomonas sp.]|nr:glycosyltransferase [Roseomonas sp.]
MRFGKILWGGSKVGSTKSAGTPESLRDVGDRLRDIGKKVEAAEAYGEHLVLEPKDFEIWVQRGNCLKDTGQHAAALMAYEQAVALRPDDADVYLQMGHAHKLNGNSKKAAEAYNLALEKQPTLYAAANELQALGARVPARRSPLDEIHATGRAAIILDVTDLLLFLSENNRVTGIQRVQACLVAELLKASISSGDFAVETKIVSFYDPVSADIYAVAVSAMQELFAALASDKSNVARIKEAVGNVYSSKTKISPRKGDSYIILGAFWIFSSFSNHWLRLKIEGVKIGIYIYDLIPFTHPQFVHDSTREAVIGLFDELMALADFILTISKYVAREVEIFTRDRLGRTLPILAVPLAHELPVSAGDEVDELESHFLDIVPSEFVLCVCTLEGRKNHLLLLNIWRSLIQKLGDGCPSLVLVGKWGWRIEEFQKELFASNYLDGKVVVFQDLSDIELCHLYRNCTFTLFPSFAEGWGLPVGESLAYGKPCIASNTTSIPEVGGDFCRYINPYDPMEALQAVERTLADRADLAAWAKRIEAHFKVRTWADVTKEFSDATQTVIASLPATNEPAVTLAERKVYKLTAPRVKGQDSDWRDRKVAFALAKNWHLIEDWGAWSRKPVARLLFGTTCNSGERIRVLVSLRLPPPTDIGVVTLSTNGGVDARSVRLSGSPQWVAFEATVNEEKCCEILLQRVGHVLHFEINRELFVGIDAIVYHRSDDIMSRMDVLEAILMPGHLLAHI